MHHLADRLDLGQLLALAERESGAYGLLDDGLRGRVAAAVEMVNARGPYSPEQVRAMRNQLKQLLANRLRMKLDRARFPAIASEEIDRPIFIIGFARSGTTLLHSLLAEDPEVLAPQSWHIHSPSPPQGAGPVAQERIAYAQRQVEAWMDLCPAQKPMHPYIDKGAWQLCEDEEVFAFDFRNSYPYEFWTIPTLESFTLFDADFHAGFRFHREFLQHVQWNSGRSRWACKGPGVQGNLDALFAVYPDALCVWPHRPINEIYASLVVLSAAVYDAITGGYTDLASFGRPLAEGMKAAFDHLLSNAMIDDPRIMHMPFRAIAADPMAAIRDIYARQDRDVTPEFARRAEAWLADPANAVDRYGRYPYSYEALGLDEAWVTDLFKDYSKRFGLD